MNGNVEVISVGSKDAARITGIPARTLREWTRQGKIAAARRLGRKSYTYIVEELRAMIMNAPKVEAH